MYLSRLDMVGFKSFAHKIDLSFTDGVTAIVGPNGCGKTNIVDAIRWVLGEQKTSMLRADSMEQVIFNGSKARKPLGMAEVSLTIENNKHILPTEYNQVVITRRLFRSGESQYLLNRTQCRLRDIVDLFMDTGMGANAYSVIELKMIETILSDKADERRHLFEEAAGVTKYKARRKEAARKLEAAQRDIARVQDIVREVQKTVNSLARQAEKARKHQELSAELKNLERRLFAQEYAAEWAKRVELDGRINDVRQRHDAIHAALAEAEAAVTTAEQQHDAAEVTLRNVLQEETDVRTVVSDVRQTLSVTEERIVGTQGALERLARQRVESSEQQSTTAEQLTAVRQRLEAARQELVGSTERVDQQRSRVDAARRAFEQIRERSAAHRQAEAAARSEVHEHRSVAERTVVQQEAMKRRIADHDQQLQRYDERLAGVQHDLEREGQNLPALDTALADAESRLHEEEQRQIELQGRHEAIQQSVNDLRSDLAHKSASLEFLVGLVDTIESSKFLLNSTEWNPSGDKLTLAEVINTSDDHRVAIEAALGGAARYFVVANKEEAAQAIGALSRHNVGKATFLCRDSIPSMGKPPADISGHGIVGWASELIDTDEGLKGAVRAILGKTIVVRSMDDAWSALEASGADSAVSLNGEIVYRSGAIRGGSRTSTEGVRVGRRERIEQLKGEIEALQQQISDGDRELADVKAALSQINVKALADAVRRAAVERNAVQQRVDALQGRVADIQGQRTSLMEERQAFLGEIEALDERRTDELAKAAESEQRLRDLEASASALEAEMQEGEAALNEVTAALREAEILMVRVDGDVQALEADEKRLSMQGLSLDDLNERHDREHEELVQRLKTLTTERDAAAKRVEEESARLAEITARRQHHELTVRELSAATHAAVEAVRKQRVEVDAVTSSMHDLDLKHSAAVMRIESLQRKAVEELEIEISDEPMSVDETENLVEVREEAQNIRGRLTSMGNVNFLALEEHERENERLEFMSQQLQDLVAAERTLNETIAEINQTAKEKFTTTFDAIRTNFIDLFKVLFSEDDEADLQLIESDDQDPLESKIEIIAKPRGKRPHSIEMLSGGEKTLTAIALLFAIYLVKPSPFCILDEVDAPLDDANIDRYLKIIRKFSENTQFLMITHNKKTMEAADTLYGVTMEEPAVSKVVSVQLTGEGSSKAAAA
jgi:chromosome segregation protein